jgi:hypothetical protein
MHVEPAPKRQITGRRPSAAARIALAWGQDAEAVKALKKEIPASSTTSVDALVRVRGTVTKSADYDAAPPMNLLTPAHVAYLLAKLGIERSQLIKPLARLARIAGRSSLKAPEVLEHAISDYLGAARARLPKENRDGSVRVAATFEFLPTPRPRKRAA